ncbi:MAG: hypothetical protein ACXWCU_08385 [Caldimonas sp.]
MILSWFDAREATQFGASLAEMLIERTPAEGAVMGKRMLTKKHEAMMHQLEQQVSRFKTQHKLNAYKKAQLGNKFKWTLKDKGYDGEYVDQMTNWLMVKLSAV